MKRLLFFLATVLYAQNPDTGSNIIRSETRVVLVDTVVTDRKGNYVRDLTQKDFKVFEDNKEQTITSFSHEAGSQGDASGRKHYTMLFFDDTTSSPVLQSLARGAAAKFIDANAGPDKMMAIAELGAGLKVTQNFTEDGARLKQAVAGSQFSSSASAGSATLGDYAMRSSLSALRGAVKSLGALPGRKSLVLVAGGYPSTSSALNEITALIEACNQANVAIYPMVPAQVAPLGGDASGLTDAGSSAGAPTTRTARRGGANGAQATADTSTVGLQQLLYQLASGSGGFVIDAASDVTGGFAKIAKEQEEYYLLGYTPAKDAAPGACHTLRVKVDRGGENVRSRNGYCEAKSLDILSGTPTERDLEARIAANATPTITGASLLIPFFYTAANTARVDVALELPAGAFQFSKEKGRLQSTMNLVGIAYLDDGTVKARFSDSVKVAFDDKKQADAFAAKPYHYEKQFRIGPGAYNFRLVFSSSAAQFGRADTSFTVEPWDPSKFAISGLALSRNVQPAKDPGSIDIDAPEDYVPLKSGSAQVTPSGSSHFRKSEKCYVYAELYEPALAVPGVKPEDIPAVGVRMELLDPKTSKVQRDFGLLRLPLPPITGSPAVTMGLALDLADVAPGDYRIRVTALDAKNREAARTIDIKVEN